MRNASVLRGHSERALVTKRSCVYSNPATCSHRTQNIHSNYQHYLEIFKSHTKYYLRLHYLQPVYSVEQGSMDPA